MLFPQAVWVICKNALNFDLLQARRNGELANRGFFFKFHWIFINTEHNTNCATDPEVPGFKTDLKMIEVKCA